MDATDRRLLGRLQQDFPIIERPYRELGREFNLSEEEIIGRVQKLKEAGLIRSINAIFHPARLGFKTVLVALRVMPEYLPEVAEKVNRFPEVTHNYSREDEFNLWFTLVAFSEERVNEIVSMVEKYAGVKQIMLLPTLREFKLKVHFDFDRGATE